MIDGRPGRRVLHERRVQLRAESAVTAVARRRQEELRLRGDELPGQLAALPDEPVERLRGGRGPDERRLTAVGVQSSQRRHYTLNQWRQVDDVRAVVNECDELLNQPIAIILRLRHCDVMTRLVQ